MEIEELIRLHAEELEARSRLVRLPVAGMPAAVARRGSPLPRLVAGYALLLFMLTAGSWFVIRRLDVPPVAGAAALPPETRLSQPFLASASGLSSAYAQVLQ